MDSTKDVVPDRCLSAGSVRLRTHEQCHRGGFVVFDTRAVAFSW